VYELYAKEMYTRTGYFAAWLPSMPVALGDVGVLKNNRFSKITTLAQLDVSFQVGAASKPADLDYSTAEYVSVSPGVSLDAAGASAHAGLNISFGRAGATLFQARDCVLESVENLPELERALLDLRSKRRWRSGYVVVTTVLRTGPTVIVVSDERGASMEVRVDAGALSAAMPVAAGLGHLEVTSRKGVTVEVLSREGATPLFRVSRLRRRPLGSGELVFWADEEQLELAAVEWTDLAEAQ
jgi:hypothetical protein